MARIYLEIEGTPTDDGEEHPLVYFKKELKEFFEQYGWAIEVLNDEEEE